MSGTSEDRETVDGFVEELGAEYPILVEAGSGFGQYSTGGVPTSYLIGADGKVVWHGHPAELKDDELEGYLKDVAKEHRVSSWAFLLSTTLPPFPGALSSASKQLEKMKFGAALKTVEAGLEKLEGEEKEAGETIREWLAGRATRGLERATELVEKNQIYKAYLLYEEIEDSFSGHDYAKQAKDAAKALKSDKAKDLEIKASEKLEKIKKEMADERKPEDKLKCLKPLLSKKYEETQAGQEAAKLAKELEALVD